MTSFWEILKSSKNLKASDAFAELWGKSIADSWDIITITGTLPLTFEAKGEALKNYRLYGTSEGAGVETANLYNYQNKDPDNGYVDNSYIRSNGNLASSSLFEVSEYVPIEENTAYYLYWRIDTSSSPGYVFYDENKARVGGGTYGERSGASITTPSNARYLRFSVRKNTSNTPLIGLYMTEPDAPVPYGYQIPLTATSGETENLFNYAARNVDKGFVASARLMENGSLDTGTASANWCVSEYINIEGGEAYTWKWTTVETPVQNDASIAFYDTSKAFLVGIAYSRRGTITATAPQNAAYIRVSFLASEGTTLLDCMLVKGSTAPDHYVPHRYTADYNLYIGDTKLGAEEYVDYQEQKVYKKNPTVVYGWHVNPSESDSSMAVTYLNDSVGMTPAAMGVDTFSYGDWQDAFFMPKPCMLKSDGTVDYYLDPSDYTKKADGTVSDVANPNYDGNAMMEWPLIWYKFEAGTYEGEGYFYCSNNQVDNTYHCWCNYDANDNITGHFYTAIYNGTGTTKLRSLSGITLDGNSGCGGTTGQEEVDRAIANNVTSVIEWYTDIFSDRLLINALLILLSKNLNTQAAYGRGLAGQGGQTLKEAYVTGTLDDKGLFWGNTTSHDFAVKVFGMENWYACVQRRTSGIIGTSDGYAVKLTYGIADGSTANGYNSTGNGYIAISDRPSSSNYISKMQFTDKGTFPLAISGGTTTYWADYFYYGSSYGYFGGASGVGYRAGAYTLALGSLFSDANWNISTCLSCKPLMSKSPRPSEYTPQNPPVSFPAITAYKGENTLDSSETVGEVSVTGKIKEI